MGLRVRFDYGLGWWGGRQPRLGAVSLTPVKVGGALLAGRLARRWRRPVSPRKGGRYHPGVAESGGGPGRGLAGF
ncbi:MAG: hypothetical protein ABT940_00960 [Alphaproteobacteria bacterium]